MWSITPSTPGMCTTAEASMSRMRPRDTVEVTTQPKARSGIGTSAAYRAVPVTLARPSIRGRGVPTAPVVRSGGSATAAVLVR